MQTCLFVCEYLVPNQVGLANNCAQLLNFHMTAVYGDCREYSDTLQFQQQTTFIESCNLHCRIIKNGPDSSATLSLVAIIYKYLIISFDYKGCQ